MKLTWNVIAIRSQEKMLPWFTAHHRQQNSVEGFFVSPNKLAIFP